MSKRFLIMLCVISLSFLGGIETLACVGGRPMAMGACFTAVADDINAVYWNPAGLVQLEGNEFTWTYTLNYRDYYNYDDYLAVGTYNQRLGLAIAVGYINIDDCVPFDRTLPDGNIPYKIEKRSQLIFSVAKRLNDQWAIGGNIRFVTYELGYDFRPYFNESDDVGFLGVDLSLFFKATEQLRFGLLLQDLNRPTFEIYDGCYDMDIRNIYILNVRPAVAYQVTDSLLVTASVYDLLGETKNSPVNQQGFRFGVEQWINNFALRAGTDRGERNFGLGLKLMGWEVDYVYLPDKGNVQMLGLIYRF